MKKYFQKIEDYESQEFFLRFDEHAIRNHQFLVSCHHDFTHPRFDEDIGEEYFDN